MTKSKPCREQIGYMTNYFFSCFPSAFWAVILSLTIYTLNGLTYRMIAQACINDRYSTTSRKHKNFIKTPCNKMTVLSITTKEIRGSAKNKLPWRTLQTPSWKRYSRLIFIILNKFHEIQERICWHNRTLTNVPHGWWSMEVNMGKRNNSSACRLSINCR